MNNNRGMMTTLLSIGAAGAAIYGIRRGMQNGTFQQIGKSFQNMTNNQGIQEITNTLQDETSNTSDSLMNAAQNLE